MSRLLLTLLMAPLAVSAGARDIQFRPDAHGYAAGACDYDYVDLSATHEPLALTAVPGQPAADEGGAPIALPRALPFYGGRIAHWVVSTNGYLAAADGLAREDGGEFRNTCPLPFAPTNTAGSAARILPLQGDLEGHADGAAMFAAHFDTCPRTDGNGGQGACTVVQWHRWGLHGRSGELDFQVVLYPRSGEIVLQYQTLDAELAGLATGIQSPNAATAVNLGCGMWQTAQAGTAYCLNPPDELFRDRFETE